MLSIKTLGASAVALVAGAGIALAADLPNYQPPPAGQVYNPVPAYDWNGPYLGLTGGYGWGTSSGWLGGVYAGYNFQVDPHWIVGLEGDGILTNKSTNSWDATVRGRLGYAYDRFLFYGTGGVAFGNVESNDGGNVESATKVGWTLGAGIEAALSSKVTGRIEYRHTDLGTATFPTNSSVGYTANDLMVGIGVKF
jgi:outer membrane immunogenic protein